MQNLSGCWIPPQLYHDDNLSHAQKILLGRLHTLSQKTGYCWATNNYLSDDIGVTKLTIKRWLPKLEEQGYIDRVTTDNERMIKVNLNPKGECSDDTPYQNDTTPQYQNDTPMSKDSSKESTTSNEVKDDEVTKEKQGKIVEILEQSPLEDNKKWALAGKWIKEYGYKQTRNVLAEMDCKDKFSQFEEGDNIVGYIVEWIKNYDDDKKMVNDSINKAMGY